MPRISPLIDITIHGDVEKNPGPMNIHSAVCKLVRGKGFTAF